MKKTLLHLLLLLFFASCGNFVDRLHRQIDAESSAGGGSQERDDQFSMYRSQSNGAPQPIGQKQPVHNMVSTNNNSTMSPPVQREYLPETEVKRRFTATDLEDNSGNGSLWATPNNSSSLFANDERKATGDILLINVQSRLKDEISMTLKKFFPPNEVAKKENEKTPASVANTGGPQAKEPVAADDANDEKYHDKISSVIVEEINREHVLIRGRKSVMFHNRKRLVEIQAMASRRDIKMDNSVDSDNILESSIQVLR